MASGGPRKCFWEMKQMPSEDISLNEFSYKTGRNLAEHFIGLKSFITMMFHHETHPSVGVP